MIVMAVPIRTPVFAVNVVIVDVIDNGSMKVGLLFYTYRCYSQGLLQFRAKFSGREYAIGV